MLLHLLFGNVHFCFQLPGGHSQHTTAEGTELHQGIGGGYANGIVAADLVSQRLDILVCSDAFLGVNHLDVVQLPLFADASLVFVAVKDHHQTALGEPGIIGKGITELPPGGIQISSGLLCQMLPGL